MLLTGGKIRIFNLRQKLRKWRQSISVLGVNAYCNRTSKWILRILMGKKLNMTHDLIAASNRLHSSTFGVQSVNKWNETNENYLFLGTWMQTFWRRNNFTNSKAQIQILTFTCKEMSSNICTPRMNSRIELRLTGVGRQK